MTVAQVESDELALAILKVASVDLFWRVIQLVSVAFSFHLVSRALPIELSRFRKAK